MQSALLIASWGMHGWGAGGWVAMGAMMLLLWALIVWAILAVVGRGFDGGRAPEDVLKRRLARGDITVEEYERRSRALRRDDQHPAAT